jgi:PAS domain S-box-containing protein
MAILVEPPLPGPRGRFARRTGAVIAAGVLLVTLVGSLLVLNVRSLEAIRDHLLRQHAHRLQLHGAALGHFLDSATRDVRNLAESREVAAFHESRDLGMTMEYGLALALVPIRERLGALTGPDLDGQAASFARLAFVDGDGTVLVDSGDAAATALPELLDPSQVPEGVSLSADGMHIFVRRAHWFKGRLVGHLIAWLSPEQVRASLSGGAAPHGESALHLLADDGREFRPGGTDRVADEERTPPSAIPPTGEIVFLPDAGKGPGDGSGRVAARVPIPGHPFTVVDVDRIADVVGGFSPASNALYLSVAAIAILLVVILAVFLNTKALLLQARLDESVVREREVSEKHRALEREVAERRRLEAAHALLALAANQAAEAIAVTDLEGRVEYLNPSFAGLVQAPPSGLLGRRFSGIRTTDDEEGRDLTEIAHQATHVWKGEVTICRGDGPPVEAQLMISPVRDATDAVCKHLWVARDVTEEKKLRAQLRHAQKLEAVGTLAGGVAHDFNNLLAVINGYAQLAVESLKPGNPIRDDMIEVRRAASRATDLTRQLLAFSRKQVMKPQVIYLNDAVAGVQKMLGRLIGEDIELVTVPGGELWPVRVDPGQLEQVLVNLVVNARDAMSSGGRLTIASANVEVTEAEARTIPGAAPGRHVRLTVTDTGEGMSAATLSHIFEPFFTTKEQGKGTGLGLPTVYGIVRQSRGFLTVDSAPGRGTTFGVFLPAVTEEEAHGGTSDELPATFREITQAGETVLVVEDETQVRNLLRSQLSAEGYRVLTASDGVEAMELAKDHGGPIGLLLSDVVMPRMGGPQLARAFLKQFPGTPVVFMSGYAGEALTTRAEIGQAAAFVQKPWELPELAATLRRVLQGTRHA